MFLPSLRRLYYDANSLKLENSLPLPLLNQLSAVLIHTMFSPRVKA